MRDPQSAIGAEEADHLLAPLRAFAHVLLAVSGGPDSMALMQLVAEWRRRHGDAPQVSVATVDHQLRDESAAEAAFVRRRAEALGLPHTTLAWRGVKPETGLPDAARDARYRLLTDHVRRSVTARPAAILTAHTLDDQAETVLMRLKRGSGVDGLAAIPVQRPVAAGSDIVLLRPLLAVPKSRLLTVLDVRGLSWCEDPTNADSAHERVQMRAALSDVLADIGISAAALASTARRMQSAREALDYAMAHFEQSLKVDDHAGLYASIDRAAFDAGPPLLCQRILARLIGGFGGATPAPQLAQIEHAVAALKDGTCSSLTLGGATVSPGVRTTKVWREVGRLSASPLPLTPGDFAVWDARFRVGLSADAAWAGSTPIEVRALDRHGLQQVRAAGHSLADCPARAAYALPGFWRADVLLAAPQLGFSLVQPAAASTGCATPFISERLCLARTSG